MLRTLVSFYFEKVPLKEIIVELEKSKSHIEFLAQLPPVEVYSFHRNKEIDYEMGSRYISMTTNPNNTFEFLYTVKDKAEISFKRLPPYSDFVGEITYTSQEVEKLRNKRG